MVNSNSKHRCNCDSSSNRHRGQMEGDLLTVQPEGKLAAASISFDAVQTGSNIVTFTYTARGPSDHILETFETELHVPILSRSLSSAERKCLIAFGIFHSTYVYLPFAPAVKRLCIRAAQLSTDEVQFFEKALEGALAEYYYLADMNIQGAICIECCPSTSPASDADEHIDSQLLPLTNVDGTSAQPTALVPFGGGKDSTLLMQLLHNAGCAVQWVYYGEWLGSWQDYTKFDQLVAASPSQSVVIAEQHLPCLDRLKQLNMRPDLHFPDYVAYVSFYVFSSAFVALQQNYNYICVGNEHSANFGNAIHPRFGYQVNHQFEKSFAAETAFHHYLRDHIHSGLYYFSGLQHMTELEIARLFTLHCQPYLPYIISCNWATDDHWCGKCEKCAFVFSLFSAFMPVTTVMKNLLGQSVSDPTGSCAPGGPLYRIHDMYCSEEHVPLFESLMGLRGNKPLECVGTPEEVLAAMYLTYERQYKRYEQDGAELPLLYTLHGQLILQKGKEAWEKLEADSLAARGGQGPSVPTLHPTWYQAFLSRMSV